MDSDRKLGFLLLFSGILMMFLCLLTAFLVFSGMRGPPVLFNLQKAPGSMTIAGIEMPSFDIIPMDYLNLSGNLTFFVLFLFFVASIAGKISSLGVSLIKQPKNPV